MLLSEGTLRTSAMVTDLPDGYPVMVLLVDDQPIVGEAIRRMVAGHPDIDFHYCPSAQLALAIAREIKPTVILQDLAMPDADGLEMVQQYRSDPVTCHTPVIVLSATELPAVKREAFHAGVNDYLVKIPDEIELIARLRHHSKAYLVQMQRDDAYRALRESQQHLMEMNFELQRLMNADSLTGVSNRRYFDQQIRAEWARAQQNKTRLSLWMVDVDHFKQINDTSGHRSGDAILKAIAETMLKMLPPGSCVARYGGDEFAVVMKTANLEEEASQAQELCREVEKLELLRRVTDTPRNVTVSVGCASVVPMDGISFHSLLEEADQAMFEAKKAGRNQAVLREL